MLTLYSTPYVYAICSLSYIQVKNNADTADSINNVSSPIHMKVRTTYPVRTP